MDRYDGIIFDVDGTIWDSTPTVTEAWNRALSNAGYSEKVTADRLKGLFGLPMDDIIHDILPDSDRKERDKVGTLCYKYEHEYVSEKGAKVYEGLGEALSILSERYPLFVVSNCQAGYIELMLEKTGFGKYFKDHVCPGDTNLLKAENILLIAERNGLKNPIYVGDTHMDEEACVKAGVPIVFASYGFGKVEKPDFIIDSPMDLVKVFGFED